MNSDELESAAFAILTNYQRVARTGGSEADALHWITVALNNGHAPSDMIAATKAYVRQCDPSEPRWIKTAAKFFALDGSRFHWQQFLVDSPAPSVAPLQNSFSDSLTSQLKIKKRGD